MTFDPVLAFIALGFAALAVCLALDENAERRDARRRNQAQRIR